jgi:predicted lactoylglutathione lyase
MVSESEWRKIWKEMHDYVAEKGGKSPGSRPITEPGTYTFEWDDDDGHHVYEMEVIEKRR